MIDSDRMFSPDFHIGTSFVFSISHEKSLKKEFLLSYIKACRKILESNTRKVKTGESKPDPIRKNYFLHLQESDTMYAKAKVSMEQRRTGMLACVERIYGQSVREEHNLIKVEHVKKSFKEKEVLKDITFEFLPDRVYVIIAPNGTGKTTFINTLCGFMLPDEGTISFSDGMDEQGFDVILSGERNLYVKNTVYENLIYFSMLKGMSKSTADAAIDRGKEKFPIYETVKNKLVETLSYGQKRIVSLMSAVVTGAKCVIIDEATDGLDIDNRKLVADTIRSVRDGRSIIVIAHDFSFASDVADTLIFLKDGRFAEVVENARGEEIEQIYKKLYHGEVWTDA